MDHGAINLQVFLAETLEGLTPAQLADELKARFPVRTAILDRGGAVAVNFTNTPVVEGMNEENLRDLAVIGEIWKSIGHRLRPFSPLLLMFPAKKYHCSVWLPDRETRSNKILFFTTESRQVWPAEMLVEFRTHRGSLKENEVEQLEAIAADWRADCGSRTYDDEQMDPAWLQVQIARGVFSIRASAPASRVTLPWLDLCIRVRRDRGLRKALSEIHFRKTGT